MQSASPLTVSPAQMQASSFSHACAAGGRSQAQSFTAEAPSQHMRPQPAGTAARPQPALARPVVLSPSKEVRPQPSNVPPTPTPSPSPSFKVRSGLSESGLRHRKQGLTPSGCSFVRCDCCLTQPSLPVLLQTRLH